MKIEIFSTEGATVHPQEFVDGNVVAIYVRVCKLGKTLAERLSPTGVIVKVELDFNRTSAIAEEMKLTIPQLIEKAVVENGTLSVVSYTEQNGREKRRGFFTFSEAERFQKFLEKDLGRIFGFTVVMP